MSVDEIAAVTILIRLLAPLSILRFPLVGTLLSALLDVVDHDRPKKID